MSLRARVALASAIVAAFVGLFAAGAAAILVDRLEESAQDRRLTDAATVMQRELAESRDLRAQVDDERFEIAPLGLFVALFADGVRVAGSLEIPEALAPGCSFRAGAAGTWRSCAAGPAARRVVVSTRSDGPTGSGVQLLAVLFAGALAAAVGAAFSRTLAGWALAPLTALGARIEEIADVDEADLGAADGPAEVEALRETIRALLGRLGTGVERSNGFAASAAHELRTPLATMMAELDLAAEESPEASASLGRVRRTLSRMSVLVERLLMSATGSAAALVTEAVAMEDVVADVVAARPEAERARVTTALEATGMVRGDEALLRIVVDNLVDNALKFAKSGLVGVRLVETEEEVRLTVHDEGPGIDPADADRLLLAFARGTNAAEGAVAGHGLGLSIVAHAVRLHGGDVRFVTPETGRGAELRVTLPAWTAAARA